MDREWAAVSTAVSKRIPRRSAEHQGGRCRQHRNWGHRRAQHPVHLPRPAPLRGIFPTVSFYGQAAEVVAIPPRLLISIGDAKEKVPEGDPGDDNKLVFEIRFSAPNTQRVEIKHEGETGITGAGSVVVDEGECCFEEIEVPVIGDENHEGDDTRQFELELVLAGPCAPDAPALANPMEESSEIEIQCDDKDASTYRMPVDPVGDLKPGYWKTQVEGTITDNDPPPPPNS